MSNAITPSQERAYQLMYYQQLLRQTYRVESLKDLPFKVEHVMKIFIEKSDFLFDDLDERLYDLLLLAACLYATFKSNRICYISPTVLYAQQAEQIKRNRLLILGSLSKSNFPVVVPLSYGFSESVKKSQVAFMHGRDFTEYLPKDWSGRKIIQIFPNEEVPADPIWRRQGCHDAE